MKSLQQHINEKLSISKSTKQEITWDLFTEALLNHNDGILNLDYDNIEIFVSPSDDLSNTILGKLKGCQITSIEVYEQHNKYHIHLSINSGYQSGLNIYNMDDLRDVIGDEQIEKIYFAVL